MKRCLVVALQIASASEDAPILRMLTEKQNNNNNNNNNDNNKIK